METLVIETDHGKKGRSFRAKLLGYVTADHLWEGGRSDSSCVRPAVMVLAGSEAQMGPFVANLRGGKKAAEDRMSRGGRRFELLRSAGYAFAWQRFPEGCVVTAYLPELVRLDPGMVDPAGARFLLVPSLEWVEAERVRIDVDDLVAHAAHLGLVSKRGPITPEYARELAPLASLFVAYLDRRVRAPLMPDARFHAQALFACLHRGLATAVSDRHGIGLRAAGLAACGFASPIAFEASQPDIESLLAEQVSAFFGARRAA